MNLFIYILNILISANDNLWWTIQKSIFSIQYNSDIYDILKKNDNWFMTDYEVKRCYNYRWGL